jgi:hypothetical protein
VEIKPGEIVLCEFYFSDFKASKHRPVVVHKRIVSVVSDMIVLSAFIFIPPKTTGYFVGFVAKNDKKEQSITPVNGFFSH